MYLLGRKSCVVNGLVGLLLNFITLEDFSVHEIYDFKGTQFGCYDSKSPSILHKLMCLNTSYTLN